jgi:hypothetical protein
MKGKRKPRLRTGGKRQSGQSVAEAIIAAAAEIGEDLRGKHGLQGYLRRLAVRHPPLFARLLSVALPPEGKPAAPIEQKGPGITIQGPGMSIHDVVAALRDSGKDEVSAVRQHLDNPTS